MSSTDGEASGRTAFLEALRVRQNAVRGFVAGILFTAAVFLVFVVLPAGTDQSMLYYLALAFVLALTVGGLATVVLVGIRAYRLSQDL
ncbi:MAG: hypothetical protein V5A39_04305 [Haloarculaceae archaeon]